MVVWLLLKFGLPRTKSPNCVLQPCLKPAQELLQRGSALLKPVGVSWIRGQNLVSWASVGLVLGSLLIAEEGSGRCQVKGRIEHASFTTQARQ